MPLVEKGSSYSGSKKTITKKKVWLIWTNYICLMRFCSFNIDGDTRANLVNGCSTKSIISVLDFAVLWCGKPQQVWVWHRKKMERNNLIPDNKRQRFKDTSLLKHSVSPTILSASGPGIIHSSNRIWIWKSATVYFPLMTKCWTDAIWCIVMRCPLRLYKSIYCSVNLFNRWKSREKINKTNTN